jgi:MFS family permease
MIGLSSATLPCGLLIAAPLVPPLVAAIGARRLALLCALLGGISFLAVAFMQNWFAWFVLRFAIGIVVTPLYILGEIWALALAPPTQRGRVMGFFNTLISVGYSIGPLTLTVLGAEGPAPFLVAVAAFFGCAATLARVSGSLSDFTEEKRAETGGFAAFARQAPALLVAVATAAATQQALYSLLPVFGAPSGLSDAALTALVTVLSAGNILLQVPLGLLAERHGARSMILGCAAATLASAALLPSLISTAWIWPLLLLLGGVGYGVYTMATVELGERFKGSALVAGNAAFALVWGAGGIVGAPVAGFSMDYFGPNGLPATLVAFCAAMLLFVGYRTLERRRSVAKPDR